MSIAASLGILALIVLPCLFAMLGGRSTSDVRKPLDCSNAAEAASGRRRGRWTSRRMARTAALGTHELIGS